MFDDARPDAAEGVRYRRRLRSGNSPENTRCRQAWRAGLTWRLSLQIPHGWYGQIFGRSSVFQRGLSVHPGVIDADYRGSVQLLVENRRRQTLYVEAGERLAQLLILPVSRVTLHRVSPEEIEPSRRGAGGFGSTGR